MPAVRKSTSEVAPQIRTVVRASKDLAIPPELTNWASLEGVRIVSRASLRDVLVAAQVTSAALLILDCEIVKNDPASLSTALSEASLGCAVLCVGGPELASAFLDHGADDFIGRGATYTEFLGRAKRLLESATPTIISGVRRPAKSALRVGPLLLELIAHEAYVNDRLLPLRRSEFEVLVFLALNRHRVVSAKEILHEVLNARGDGSAARNQLFEIRRKLRGAGLPDAIVTRHGQGYRLVL